MYSNVMVNGNRQQPLIYAWTQSTFTIYNLTDAIQSPTIPRESLISPNIEEGIVEFNNNYYKVNHTMIDLNRLYDWSFGAVYAIIQHSYVEQTSFLPIERTRCFLVNMTPIMVAHDCSNVVEAYGVWRSMQADPDNYLIIGLLIVTSKIHDIDHNILITFTTPLDRALSLKPAIRYENFDIEQALQDIENAVIFDIDLQYPSRKPSALWIESISRHSNGWDVNPIQFNEPFCIDFNLNTCVTAKGYIPYYTINCIGFGRLVVNDYPATRLVLQLPNTTLNNNCELSQSVPCIVTQWLVKHKYCLLKDFRGNETKVRYNCYY